MRLGAGRCSAAGAVSGWGELTAAFVVFVLAHALPARPPVRGRLVAIAGERVYLVLYSVVSLGLFAWIVAAAGRAPIVVLWDVAAWQFWVPPVAMAVVSLLVAFGTAIANPFSLGGSRGLPFDPMRPGIVGVTRHPLLWAIVIWALAHVVPNGDLAHVLVFGSFAALSVVGMVILDRRARRRLGPSWADFSRNTAVIPFGAGLRGVMELPATGLRAVVAAAIYAALLVLHEPVIGVSPLPMP